MFKEPDNDSEYGLFPSSDEFQALLDKTFGERDRLIKLRVCTPELMEKLKKAFPRRFQRLTAIEDQLTPPMGRDTAIAMLKEWEELWFFLIRRMPLTPEAKAKSKEKG